MPSSRSRKSSGVYSYSSSKNRLITFFSTAGLGIKKELDIQPACPPTSQLMCSNSPTIVEQTLRELRGDGGGILLVIKIE